MKKISKRISKWGLAGLGFVIAALTYCGYRMFSVVYGPQSDADIEPCIYGPPPLEIKDIDSLKNDTVNNTENLIKNSENIKSSITKE